MKDSRSLAGFLIIIVYVLLMACFLPLSLLGSPCSSQTIKISPEKTIDQNTLDKVLPATSTLLHNTLFLEFMPYQGLSHPDTPRYLKMLMSLQQTYEHGRAVVVVQSPVNGKFTSADRSLADSLKGLQLEMVLDSQEVSQTLGIYKGCYLAALADSNRVVQFLSDVPVSFDLLRKLASEYGGARVSTNTAVDTLFRAFCSGKRVPSISVKLLNSATGESLTHLSSTATTCFLFSAACAKCQIRSFMQHLGQIENVASKTSKDRLICLIEGELAPKDIEEYLEYYNVSMPVLDTDHFTKVSYRAYDINDAGTLSRVVRWGDDGIIDHSESFDTYFERIKSENH